MDRSHWDWCPPGGRKAGYGPVSERRRIRPKMYEMVTAPPLMASQLWDQWEYNYIKKQNEQKNDV